MARKLKIDFVSDIACPGCVIGLGGLEKAPDNLTGEIGDWQVRQCRLPDLHRSRLSAQVLTRRSTWMRIASARQYS